MSILLASFPMMDHLICNKEKHPVSFLSKFFRLIPLFILLSLLLCLFGCSDTSSGSNSSIHINSSMDASINSSVHTNPLSYTFELPAQQKLRDISSDFSAQETGADTGIFLLSGEKVEILVSGSASVQPGGKPSGPEGVPTCLKSDLPEPDLPCDSVVYSISISGRAGEVGNQVGFNPPTEGNLFLGVNAVNVGANAGSFSVSVLIIQKGKMAALWVAPEDGFALQGVSTALSARVFTQDTIIDSLQFTIAMAGEADVQICDAHFSSGDTYSCTWQFKQNGKILQNGSVTFGFVLNGHSQSGSPLKPDMNPAGIRTGVIRYVLSQGGIYAGYAATNLNGSAKYQKVTGSWVIPQVDCASGEVSQMGIWVGMINANPVESSVLAQLGTESDCWYGTPIYDIWWEMYPAPSVRLKLLVLPGDTVTASVAFQNSTFRLSIDDPQEKIHFSTIQPGNIADTSSAECILEAPELANQASHLADFDIVDISCRLNDTEPIADGPQDILYQMMDNGVLQAKTSNLDASGSGFTVQWKHS
jgi:Peptidase A4 family